MLVKNIEKISRLFHTVKVLRWEQFVYRLRYRIAPVRRAKLYPYDGIRPWVWEGPEVLSPSMHGPDSVRFLNLPAEVSKLASWNDQSFEKLWLYNLHYFDDLNAIDSSSRALWHYALIKQWIYQNPPVEGNGWEPYPLSLRLVNWIKWFNRTGQSDPDILDSLSIQADALSKQLEYHIFGNHLFANAKALVFAGAFFTGKASDRWLNIGLDVLKVEIPEQFLADGGHFELSPMYHCIMLWDLLELIQLAEVAQIPKLKERLDDWRNVASKALDWLVIMLHNDGEVSFFNDSAIGIAAKPADVFAFASTLGLAWQQSAKEPLLTLPESGYSRLQQGNHTVLFDHAAVGPSYLPGHAHADTLSFEWSVGCQRVIVNSGTSMYGVSAERLRQRQTLAHNTVVVDNQDSSEVWSGFRVARRANAQLHFTKIKPSIGCEIEASHDGYKRLKGRVIHTRNIKLSSSELLISDELIGGWKCADAFFHLHPSITVSKLNDKLILQLPDGKQYSVETSGSIHIESSLWHPYFGVQIGNQKLVVSFLNSNQFIKFSLIQE